ncbi:MULTISPECIES: hypothetical protein [unclassified Pseudomonas]|jgi:hypothetical protein|uniref:hypothetical protein n=1 Tax=unclassified Pseudomonas TaxID=196821 RepID=UPI001C868D17|nr:MULTISPECIES: hypothetical protein [unclassified Pseudomonas]MBX8472146.1 hypothetical protein [Pseudomonas sp. RIT778]UVM26444.1 hypothetical protein LOY31_23860 [Pseudomonas sp. B21-021]
MSSNATDNSNVSSIGFLRTTEDYDGKIDTADVTYRQSPTGNKGITLDAKLELKNPDPSDGRAYFIGMQIDFPPTLTTGTHSLTETWPDIIRVGRFTQLDSQRTSIPADSGSLTLKLFDANLGHAQGSLEAHIPMDGASRKFTAEFDIRDETEKSIY